MAAKAALNLSHANLGIPYADLKYQIDKYIICNWQDEWNNVGANKLRSVKPVLEDWHSSYRQSRRDEIILCHTSIDDSFILARDRPLRCGNCQCILTVRHILVRYPHLQPVRDDVFRNECVMNSF